MSLLNMSANGTKRLIKYNQLLVKIGNRLCSAKDLEYKFEMNCNSIPMDFTELTTTPSV